MPALSQADVEELRVLIEDKQDRAGFYARYYDLIKDINISGARQSLLQAEISSYSGFLGGGALLGNAIAKYSNPDVYTPTLDAFSYDIALNLYVQIRNDVQRIRTGVFDAGQIQGFDNAIWQQYELFEYFPGRFQQFLADVTNIADLFTAGSVGAILSALQLLFGDAVGYTASDYPGGIRTDYQDYSVIRSSSGKVLWIEDHIGIANDLDPLGLRNQDNRKLYAVVAASFGLSGVATAGLNIGLSLIAALNDALSQTALTAVTEFVKSLSNPNDTNTVLRDKLAKYLGANGEAMEPNGTLPDDFKYNDFPIKLYNKDIQNTGDGADFVISTNTADARTGGGEDFILGFDRSKSYGGTSDDLPLGKELSVLQGGAGGDIIIAGDHAKAEGGEGDDWLFGAGTARLAGGAGSDIVMSLSPVFVRQGQQLISNNAAFGNALKDMSAVADGGTGDDWVIAIGGVGAITVGGEGRDWIFNTSAYGQLYGDTFSGTDADGNSLNGAAPDAPKGYFDRGAENSDIFWFWPRTFIMDAGAEDYLKFFGLPLFGGSNSITVTVHLIIKQKYGNSVQTLRISAI